MEVVELRKELGLMTAAHESQTLNLENAHYILGSGDF